MTIPVSVTSIGTSAFQSSPNLTVALAEGRVTIDERLFSVTEITAVHIPASLTSIIGVAFQIHSKLASITVAPDNPAYASENGVLYNKARTELIAAPPRISGITIPASVTSIGDYAFIYCTGLTSIAVPAGVTRIGEWAFQSCTGLTSVTLPASVTSIGQWAFANCTSLTGITFAAGSQLTSISTFMFYNCTSLANIEIPEGVTSISGSVFSGWTNGQTIYVRGHASEAAADSAWGSFWRNNCNAVRKYWNGSGYQ